MTVKKICSDYFGQEGEATKKEVDKRLALNVETESTFFCVNTVSNGKLAKFRRYAFFGKS